MNFSKTEFGSVITLLLALIAGVLFLGRLDGRVTALEKDKNFYSVIKEQAIKEIEEKTKQYKRRFVSGYISGYLYGEPTVKSIR
ncbi:hypothetical protein MHK_010611 [Candidatus Magnetomorum sp. HK-1]|nr:hypothetical protein MHK_010611 [Candidatus Magnetomorum sp. HK-1]